MSIRFKCPQCQATRTANDALAGRRIRCPDCESVVRVPEPSASSESAPDASQPQASRKDHRSAADVAMPAAAVTPGSPEQPSQAAVTSPKPPPVVDTPAEEAPLDEYVSFRNKEADSRESEMDMTPMVDVTFLLLIFFMVTAAFSLQKSIEIPKPKESEEPSSAAVEPEDNPEMVTVLVDEFNTFHVLSSEWEKECPSEQELLVRLREAKSGGSTGVVPTKLMVKAHGDSLHERVVLALDAGTAEGFEQIQLMTVEETF